MSKQKSSEDSGQIWANLILVILLAAGCLGLVSLIVSVVKAERKEHKEKVESGFYLPPGSTDVENLGRGWQEFTYKGQRFLFHKHESHERAYESIVRIDMPTNNSNPEAE